MKWLLISLLLITPALAQQQPPQDPQVLIYRQLLDNTTSQLVLTAAELAKAKERIKELETQIQDKGKK